MPMATGAIYLLQYAPFSSLNLHPFYLTLCSPTPCRLWTVRFYSYFSLLIAVTTEIQCTQPPSEETGGQCSISFSIQDVAGQVANTSAINTCPVVSVIWYLCTQHCLYTLIIHMFEPMFSPNHFFNLN